MASQWREPASAESVFTSELATIERIIDRVAARRHLRAADADEFASHVKMKLVEDDYAILRKFQRRSSLQTFLTVVIQRLFADYCAAKWGRWRPSAEARRAGDLGVLLEQLLWRDGYSFDEAFEVLSTNYQLSVDRTTLDRIAALLPARPKKRFESDEPLGERADESSPADGLAEHGERARMAQRLSDALKRLMARVEPQDRLILALRFVDGHTVADIAAMLALDQKRLYRRLEHLLGELRAGLHAEGIAADEALAIFDDPAISVDW